jgi:hypothetical protein
MKNITAALLLLTVFASCSKDDTTAPKTVKDILVDGVWTNVQYGEDLNGNAKPDAGEFETTDACEADDLFDFVDNGTLNIDDGPKKCDPFYPTSESYNWSLGNNDKDLILSHAGYGFTSTFKIVSLSNSELVISYTEMGTMYFTRLSK